MTTASTTVHEDFTQRFPTENSIGIQAARKVSWKSAITLCPASTETERESSTVAPLSAMTTCAVYTPGATETEYRPVASVFALTTV